MDVKLQIIFIGLFASLCVTSVEGQTCQADFVASLYQCISTPGLNRENFLWLSRNGTMGSQPEDLQTFTARVCIEKPSVFLCTKAALDNAMAQPAVSCDQVMKDSLLKLFKGIFKTLNLKCADPCRLTFADTVTKCFTDQGFPRDLVFLNVTSHRDAILGTNATDVERFCQKKMPIIDCLKLASIQCNDSPIMLRKFSLDISQLDRTYTILCNHTDVYADATACFRRPTPKVMACRQSVARGVAALEAQLEDLNVTDTKFQADICRIRVDQIDCETTAITMENDTTKCHEILLGMRRQQECTMLPRECRSQNIGRVASLCRVNDFLIPDREFYKAPSAEGGVANVGVNRGVLGGVVLVWSLIYSYM